MIFKSKQILTATLIVALGAAVAVNWYYTNTPQTEDDVTTQQVSGNLGDSLYVGGTTAASTTTAVSNEKDDAKQSDYFASAKLKRKQSHDEIIDNIEDIAESDDIDSDTKKTITLLLSDFQSDIKAETDVENLISAKTGGECLVIINEGACQVILEKNTLNDLLILQITEIIEKNTEISSENLTIIEAK
jgi:stage III sporulation protein AH